MDTGERGSVDFFGAIIPTNNPINGVLAIKDIWSSSNTSSDRGIVENYFGRMCSMRMVTGSKHRSNGQIYLSFVRVCTELTNIHIKWHPVRDEDCVLHNVTIIGYMVWEMK